MPSRTNAIALAGLCLLGCAGPRGAPPPYAPRPVVELARWQIWDGDALLGRLRQLRIEDPRGDLDFYRIEDRQGRWLGHATASGRFSRRVPFQEQEQDLGVWSLPRGIARLFDAAAPVELRPIAVEADARRPD